MSMPAKRPETVGIVATTQSGSESAHHSKTTTADGLASGEDAAIASGNAKFSFALMFRINDSRDWHCRS
jgi:hypothetical protein